MTKADRLRALLAVQRHAPFGDTIAPKFRAFVLANLVTRGLVTRRYANFTLGIPPRYALTEEGKAWLRKNNLRRR